MKMSPLDGMGQPRFAFEGLPPGGDAAVVAFAEERGAWRAAQGPAAVADVGRGTPRGGDDPRWVQYDDIHVEADQLGREVSERFNSSVGEPRLESDVLALTVSALGQP